MRRARLSYPIAPRKSRGTPQHLVSHSQFCPKYSVSIAATPKRSFFTKRRNSGDFFDISVGFFRIFVPASFFPFSAAAPLRFGPQAGILRAAIYRDTGPRHPRRHQIWCRSPRPRKERPMNYANIKYCDIANGEGRAHQPVCIRLPPPLQGLLQRRRLGFLLRPAV